MSNTPAQPATYPQFIRKIGLVVFAPPKTVTRSVGVGDATSSATSIQNSSNNGLDLSQMHIKFHVEGLDYTRPKTLICRIYNLADSTQTLIKQEFQNVILQAGYENGAYGVIFNGTIARIKTGRENATDTFLEIQAADGDRAHNFAYVNRTIAAGSSPLQQAQPAIDAMKATGDVTAVDTTALSASATGGVLPRGQTQFGLAKGYLDDIAASTNTSWFIEDGKLNFVSDTGFLAGEAVVLNSQTGMIGIPEATINGIEVAALLNPNIKVGRRVQIDNASINQTQVNKGQIGIFPTTGDTQRSFFATTTNDGFYRAIVVSHSGDSRGSEWFTKMICLAIDASAAPGSSVLASG
jgi:hypothetical protein